MLFLFFPPNYTATGSIYVGGSYGVPHPCLFAEDHLKGLVSMEIAPSIVEREVPDFARDFA